MNRLKGCKLASPYPWWQKEPGVSHLLSVPTERSESKRKAIHTEVIMLFMY